MADFKKALEWIKVGLKVRRACWDKNHYWQFGKYDLYDDRLVNSIGEIPQINSNQINAQDWEIYNEKVIEDDMVENIKDRLDNIKEDAEEIIQEVKSINKFLVKKNE